MVERLQTEKSSTTALIKTSYTVMTSSPIREMTSRKPTEDVRQMETPTDESRCSTSSLIKGVMRSSEDLKIEAFPLLNKQETTYTLRPSQEKQSFLFTEIEPSSVLEQIFSSENKEEMATFKVLEINASPIIKEQEKSSSQSTKSVMLTSFPMKQTLSLQTTGKMTSSKVLEVEPSSIIKEKLETSCLFIKPAASSEAQEEMTSSQLVTSPSFETSSLDAKKEIPLKTVQATASFEIEPSSQELKEMTSLPKTMLTSSQLVKTSTSSGALEPALLKNSSNPSKDDHSSQQIEDTATPQPTKMMMSSGALVSQAFGAPIVPKHFLQQLRSPSLSKLMTSSQLLTSSEAIRSTPGETLTEPKHLEDMTSLQPKHTMTSSPIVSPRQIMETMRSSQVNKEITLSLSQQTSSLENTKASSLITNIVTSSKSIKDLTSSQTLISTPFKEVNIVISALILSSSQIADLITSAHPTTMRALTSSAAESTEEKEPSTTEKTKPLVGEKTTTTTKPLTTPQVPAEKTTIPSEMNTSDKKSVTMTTSHPTHPPVHPSEPTHPVKPIHPGDGTHHEDKNKTNKTHDDHVVKPGPHNPMGYPDEPPVVDASTNEKDDSSWQISVYVVCAMLIGIVSFVIVMIVKSNRELKR